ncbi:MAG: molecular chaperone DnaJ, partial [Acinetobacter sp.]
MSFDLKVSLQQRAEQSPQQKKLNRLIDKIEQQKVSLATWQNAQAEIQQHTRQKLLPVYSELHEILFQQLDQLWNMLHSHEFSKADMQQLDEKIAQLAQMLKRSKMLEEERLELVKQIDTFYQQHAQQSVKQNKKVQSVQFELNENFDQNIELEEDDFEQYAAEQQQAREHAKQL